MGCPGSRGIAFPDWYYLSEVWCVASAMQSPLGQVQSLCNPVAWPMFRIGVLLGRLMEAWMGGGAWSMVTALLWTDPLCWVVAGPGSAT